MSQFNQKGSVPSVNTSVGRSANGNVQLVKAPEQILFETLVSHMYGKETAFESSKAVVARFDTALADVLRKGNFTFVKNVIDYAKNEMGMRAMPLYAAIKTAHLSRTLGLKNPLVRETVRSTLTRADSLTDAFSLSVTTFGNKKAIPQAVKKALADGFSNFNEYHFSKYKSEGKAVWMRDVMRVVHPKPATPERAELYGRIKAGTLRPAGTWEEMFSANGQLPVGSRRSDSDIWMELLKNRKLGMLALLRNLRRLSACSPTPELWKLVCEQLANPVAVEKSKVFPYQIYMSYKAVESVRGTLTSSQYNQLRGALESALETSVKNVPDLGDNVWIMLDTSGSMHTVMPSNNPRRATSTGPTVKMVELGALFAAVVYKRSSQANFNVTLTKFDTSAQHLTVNPRDSVLSIVEAILRVPQGGGTNIWAALQLESRLGFIPETVLLFSDMQVNSPAMGYTYAASAHQSAKTLGQYCPGALRVAFNFATTETTPASESEGWVQLAGYSDKVFKFLELSRPGAAARITEAIASFKGEQVEEEDEPEDE